MFLYLEQSSDPGRETKGSCEFTGNAIYHPFASVDEITVKDHEFRSKREGYKLFGYKRMVLGRN